MLEKNLGNVTEELRVDDGSRLNDVKDDVLAFGAQSGDKVDAPKASGRRNSKE
jgi:hypothetical protein